MRAHVLLREYEARCCHVCQCRHPPFGFGPPLTRPGDDLWACSEHRAAVDAMLANQTQPAPSGPSEQLSFALSLQQRPGEA